MVLGMLKNFARCICFCLLTHIVSKFHFHIAKKSWREIQETVAHTSNWWMVQQF